MSSSKTQPSTQWDLKLGTLDLKSHPQPHSSLVHSKENHDLSRVVRKPDFCLCENKGADQLRSNCEADQCLCFRYTDSTISLFL